MIRFPTAIGLEETSLGIKGARVSKGLYHTIPRLELLHTPDSSLLKKGHPIIATGISGSETLVRLLSLPVTHEKDLASALPFQSEPFLPYPPEEALLSYQVIHKTDAETEIALFAVHQAALQHHLEHWQSLDVIPEQVSCIPAALSHFIRHALSPRMTCLVFHLHPHGLTAALIQHGSLRASFSHAYSLSSLKATLLSEEESTLPSINWEAILKQEASEPLRRLLQLVTRLGLALSREIKEGELEGVIVTGEMAEWEGFAPFLVHQLSPPSLLEPMLAGIASPMARVYAVPIGLAFGALDSSSTIVNFRQGTWRYPHPWRRALAPLACYGTAIACLTLSLSFLFHQVIQHREAELKSRYLTLIAGIHQSDAEIDKRLQKGGLPPLPLEHPGTVGLSARLALLQRELQQHPDAFPLLPNTPRVSDVLVWLYQHPAVMTVDEGGNKTPRLMIEHFNYAMVKRPQQGKKQEKYQVKIELEVSTSTPKWARAFHDALLSPNEWVDPKGEVKWHANRGKYKASFFLKDKTVYPR